VFVHNCGMQAIRLNLTASQLPDNLHAARLAVEEAVPVGLKGNWDGGNIPTEIVQRWNQNLDEGWKKIISKHPQIEKGNTLNQLGTLGSGNHFIELCLDESDNVWVMLHSGSRGVGNRIGQFFITTAKEEMRIHHIGLPDKDLAYLSEGTPNFADYVEAVGWAQDFAKLNRKAMMISILGALRKVLPPFIIDGTVIDCHHNYVEKENHFGHNVWVTRKGAVRARKDDMGIIPGSMGAKSFIVRGRGNPESFMSCSHGAGRKMSRSKAKAMYTVADMISSTEGIECRKDSDVIDEIPMSYKNIDDVMNAQRDLVSIEHILRQVLCVKG
jgi:tRNA-splicing ligase RtcB